MEQPKVLVVDDQASNILTTKAILEDLDLEIISATSGKAALELLLRHKFALILLDIYMPEMDGFETADYIRSNPATTHTPIIFLTSLDQSQDNISRGYSTGAVDYLFKPIEPQLLISKVSVFLELYRKQRETEHQLKTIAQMQQQYEQLLLSADEGIVGLDEQYCMTFINQAACDILQQQAHQLQGEDIHHYLPSHSDLHNQFNDAFKNNKSICFDDTFFIINDSQQVPVQLTLSAFGGRDTPHGAVLVFRDISSQKHLQKKLENLAHYDPLTNLGNRFLFNDHLKRAIETAEKRNNSIALLFIDLDHFKSVNDSLGHDMGDLVLKEVANRLTTILRSQDFVARFGGDEFAVIIEQIDNPETVTTVAHKIIDTINTSPVTLPPDDKPVFIGSSIGIAFYPHNGCNAEEVIKSADTAMYNAKRTGRSHFQYFTQSMQQHAEHHMSLRTDIHRAIDENRLILHYEPRVDLKTSNLVTLEAQIYWQHIENAPLLPINYEPLKDDTLLLRQLGVWGLNQSINDAHQWQTKEDTSLSIIIDIALQPGKEEILLHNIKKTLKQNHFPAEKLIIEMNECNLMLNPEHTINELHKLHELGIQIIINDFGTGHSVLNYLKQLPVQAIKFGPTFTNSITTDTHKEKILRAMTIMAHDLGLKVIADGIQIPEQLPFLFDIQCDQIQGPLISLPMSQQQIIETGASFFTQGQNLLLNQLSVQSSYLS